MEEFYNLIRQWYFADQTCWSTTIEGRGDVKLGRSPGWNLVRAERSRLCIYAYVERRSTDQEVNQQMNPINTCEDSKVLRSILRAAKVDEYTRSPAMMELDLAPGESRGYWKYHTLGNGSSRPRQWSRSTMKRQQYFLILEPKSRSSTPPLLVRKDVSLTRVKGRNVLELGKMPI